MENILYIFLFLFLSIDLIFAQFAVDKCNQLSEWGPWRCPGEDNVCFSEIATRFKCPEKDCTIFSSCTSLPGFQEQAACRAMLDAGKCDSWWSGWTEWSSCAATCGISERTRFRACIGATSLDAGAETSCSSPHRASEGVGRRDCPLRRLCPRIAGGWGEWGSFSHCSTTCGKGLRRRIRICNRPMPQGGGVPCQGIDTQEIECDSGIACPQDGIWCPWFSSVEQCSAICGDSGFGLRLRKCACPSPAYGGLNCKAPPGATETAQLIRLQQQQLAEDLLNRQATEQDTDLQEEIAVPSPAVVNAIADGSGRWDACNRKPCPYLKRLTSSEQSMIEQDLRIQRPEDTWSWSGDIAARKYDPVGLHCPSKRTSRVEIFEKRNRFPKARPYWTRSIGNGPYQRFSRPGIPMVDSGRILVSGDRLIIRSLDAQDEGIYRYGYEYEPENFATICFFVVYEQNKVRTLVEGSSFNLACNALGMWPIIQQSKIDHWNLYWRYVPDETAISWGSKRFERIWPSEISVPLTELEEKQTAENPNLLEDMRKSGLTLFDTETRRLEAVTFPMSGYYSCILSNLRVNMSERVFITSQTHLKVIPKATLMEVFIKWMKGNPLLIIALFAMMAVVSFAYMIFITIRSRRTASLQAQVEEREKRRQAAQLLNLES